jgi:hypothetical protein
MLTIDPTLASITAIRLSKEKTADARRKYKITLLIVLPTTVIADLSPDPELTGTFWNGNGEPQLSNLYPLHINEPIRNVRAKFHDRLKPGAGLELDGADITAITVEPRNEGRGLVEITIEGIHENGAIDAGDRLWRMIGVPTEVSIAARQFTIDPA